MIRRILAITMTTLLAVGLIACGDKKGFEEVPEEIIEKEEELIETEFDYLSFEGDYSDSYSQRASLTFISGDNSAEITVAWSSSGFEYDEWVMKVHHDNGRFVYEDSIHKRYTTSGDGDTSEEIISTEKSGYFTIKDFKLLWDGAYDEYCRECVFEQPPREDMVQAPLGAGYDIAITWNVLPEGVSLSVVINGIYKDEGFTVYSGVEGDIASSDGDLLVSSKENEGSYLYHINPDCRIDSIEIVADTPDQEIGNNAIREMNPSVTYVNQEGVTVSTADFEQYMNRFPTGVWGMAIYMNEEGFVNSRE